LKLNGKKAKPYKDVFDNIIQKLIIATILFRSKLVYKFNLTGQLV